MVAGVPSIHLSCPKDLLPPFVLFHAILGNRSLPRNSLLFLSRRTPRLRVSDCFFDWASAARFPPRVRLRSSTLLVDVAPPTAHVPTLAGLGCCLSFHSFSGAGGS